MVFDKDIPKRGKLTKNRLLKKISAQFKKKTRNTQIKNSQEMMPYWQVQNLKSETQKE